MTPKETEANYAFWSASGQTFTVNYSLEQFHEIDFQVNEGFRRIPHGGVEIGGLLFGRLEISSVYVQAFRTIECEHATGPSFNLSQRDIDELEKQIAGSRSDPELAGLELVGWFIAHTRSPLRLTERELELFNRFFPQANQITVLVKPERFQPTRFGFLTRKADGSVDTDAAPNAVILPLPGRAGRTGDGPVASIPAPVLPEKPPVSQPAAPKNSSRNTPEAFDVTPARSEELPSVAPNRHGVTRQRTNDNQPELSIPPRLPAASAATQPDTEPVTALTIIPKREKLKRIADARDRRPESTRARASEEDTGTNYNVRLALILFFAAALGCGVGYWGYRQLAPPIISVTVRPDASGLVVTWPNDQTRQAAYAAIRVNDGAQQPLSPEEKALGTAGIAPPSTSDVKVELIVQHWMRDSRGIVRYIRPAPLPAVTANQLPR